MGKTAIFSLLAYLFSVAPLSAQYYLQLKKRNKVIHTYMAGDNIKFKLKGEDFYTNQIITGVTDSTIKFRFLDVAFKDIEVLKLSSRRSYGLDLVAEFGMKAGIIFLVIDQFNQLAIQGEGLGPSSEVLIISGSLISTALIIWLLKKKKFKFKSGRYRLMATDFYIEKR
ncbi:MAG: hypothetical protein AAF843_08095 [Bacteroidota bacterium]